MSRVGRCAQCRRRLLHGDAGTGVLRFEAEYRWSTSDFDFRTAHLEDLDLSRARFSRTARFDEATFSGLASFIGATFLDAEDVRSVRTFRWSRGSVISRVGGGRQRMRATWASSRGKSAIMSGRSTSMAGDWYCVATVLTAPGR
ncbi:pentapeptide repeat-containing protein [Nocardia sp. NPDC046473]|uniref:pentapeptide repeat-containing protein n=1 Tax=Nocardia sp. NPDC046473 TaxID=3155733 RepID=UPI0033F9EF98